MAGIAIPLTATLFAAGAYQKYNATKEEGRFSEAMSNLQADQLESAANSERSMGIISGQEKLRQGRLLQSKAIARAAASGRAPSIDKGASSIIADIGVESEKRAWDDLLTGNVRASNLQLQALNSRISGRIAKKSSNKAAKGQLLSDIGGASTFISKYS